PRSPLFPYTTLFRSQLKKLGWWDRKPRVILEVGGGLGYVARDLGGGLSPEERRAARYIFVDITRPFLKTQLAMGQEGGCPRRCRDRKSTRLNSSHDQ